MSEYWSSYGQTIVDDATVGQYAPVLADKHRARSARTTMQLRGQPFIRQRGIPPSPAVCLFHASDWGKFDTFSGFVLSEAMSSCS